MSIVTSLDYIENNLCSIFLYQDIVEFNIALDISVIVIFHYIAYTLDRTYLQCLFY